eukprot:3161655-Pleurochrysis_carterae.AAC.2
MTLILHTIPCQAARRSYAAECNGSGRELMPLLTVEANAASTATNATISAMLYSCEVKGIAEPTVVAFNSFVRSIQRLNRSLPSSAQSHDTVLPEKVASAVRRLSDSLSTLLVVKLSLIEGVGNLVLTIAAACSVLSDAEARKVRRELEANPNAMNAFTVCSDRDRIGTGDPKRPFPNPDENSSDKWAPCCWCKGRDCTKRKATSDKLHSNQGGRMRHAGRARIRIS